MSDHTWIPFQLHATPLRPAEPEPRVKLFPRSQLACRPMTASSVQRKEIAVSGLDLDCENPRHGAVADQEAAFDSLVADQREKLGQITVDIHNNGLSPAQLFIVTNGTAGRYIVLDGNRRLAALRILDDPELLPPEFRPSGFIGTVSEPGNQPSQVMCAIVPNRDEARLWLDRTHSGQLAGLGTVPWSSGAKHRFNPLPPASGHTASAMTVLDWLRHRLPVDHASRPHLDTVETRSVTNLGRLASDPDIRELVGFDFQGGIVTLNDDEAAAVRRLLTIIEKLAGGASVTELKKKGDRARFAAQHLGDDAYMPAQDLLDLEGDSVAATSEAPPSTASSGSSAEGEAGPAAKAPTPAGRRRPPPHAFEDLDISPLHPRIRQIIDEVHTLNPDKHPNATAVLLRAIFELTATEYLVSKGSTPGEKTKLATNIRNAMRELGIADDDDRFRPLRTQLQQKFSIVSVPNLHQYVHNVNAAPGQSDLNSIALAYRPLLEAICSDLR